MRHQFLRAAAGNGGGGPAGLLLDDYPGAAAAYSLRQLRTGVTSVVRVRRSSDNAEADFTAAEVSNGTLPSWVGGGNGFIGTWYDQSGNGRNLSQTDLSRQPPIVTSGSLETINGAPAINYTSGDFNLLFSTNISVQTLLSVHQCNSDGLSGWAHIISLNSGGAGPWHGGDSTWLSSLWTAAGILNGAHAINGSPQGLAALARTTDYMLLSIAATSLQANSFGGIAAQVNSAGRALRAKRQEVLLWASDQTANMAGISANINSHYSIF